MQHQVSLTTRILVISTFTAFVVFFTAIVWAQDIPDDLGSPESNETPQATMTPIGSDPESNTKPAANPAASSPADEIETQVNPDATTSQVTLFKFIAGSNFHPRESTTTHSYGGAGCAYRTTVSGFLVTDLQLPQGAEVDYVRLYFDDTSSADDAHLWLYAYDGQGAFTQITEAASSGAPGAGSAGSDFFSYVVDNATTALGLVAGSDSANDSSVQICGARVRYTIEVPSYVMLPSVFKQYMGE